MQQKPNKQTDSHDANENEDETGNEMAWAWAWAWSWAELVWIGSWLG